MHAYLDKLCKAYYEGSPLIPDVEFDKLADLYNYNKVGYRGSGRIKHYLPMYSLQKCFDIQQAPIPLNGTVSTVKLDGAAVSLLYINGELTQALTRGDGVEGLDITDKIKTLAPVSIKTKLPVLQVTGEVVAPKSIPNARNYAAGALNLKSPTEFASRDLTFVAYDMQPHSNPTWSEDIDYLEDQGFEVIDSIPDDYYPTDGIVFRIDNNEAYAAKGYTSKHPRGAFALKDNQEGKITTLKDVVWQVGKSGVVSPVAILSPIQIEDAIITRATLHNIEYIKGLNLEIGCKVEVIRAGQIIPRVVKRVD